MKPRSAKAKGRRVLIELRELILRAFSELELGDIIIMPTSVGGDDLTLSPAAKRLFPFSIEGKNQEVLNIWAAIEQAESNCGNSPPAVVFRRNRMKQLWACIPVPVLLNLLQRVKSPLVNDPPATRTVGRYDKPYKIKKDDEKDEEDQQA